MSDDNIQARIHSWLDKTGFPLEAKAARAYLETKFSIFHSDVYKDPESGVSRETDIIAIRRDSTRFFGLHCVMECKSSDKPWVILSNHEQRNWTPPEWFLASSSAAAAAASFDPFQHVSIYYDVFGPQTPGYALKQAFCGQNDNAYAAAVNVFKGAFAAVNESPYLDFIVPIIVVDTPIFEYELLPSGEGSLKEIEHGCFTFGHCSNLEQFLIIRVVSINFLERFSMKCERLFDIYGAIYYDHFMKLYRARGT